MTERTQALAPAVRAVCERMGPARVRSLFGARPDLTRVR